MKSGCRFGLNVSGQSSVLLATLLCLAFEPSLRAQTNSILFNRDIRPILSENCFACHGHDKNQRKAKLRLDDRDVALEKGAILPGKPEESEMVKRIFSADEDEMMPPPKSRKKLTQGQKELLKQWIGAGAVYEPHWAYIKPQRFEPPMTKNTAWVRNPIDAFILHTLETKSIKPSKEADKATLLRRLSLDLVGLPPTLDELKAFMADNSPGAYQKQVERLLASPHFGERMAVPWLDVVRFADTVGYHGDQNQHVFPYRDYVINSFNEDKGFDRFTVEQLAGDLLPKPTEESRIATCFNRLNMVTREGGAQPKEYLAKYAADRVRTVSMAWLGSTMGCAECHDHKFDPFTSKDFYSMEAFFADIKQWGVYAEYNYTPNPELRGIGNDHPFPPEIEVESAPLERRLVVLRQKAGAFDGVLAERLLKDRKQKDAFEAWRKQSTAFLQRHPDGWLAPVPSVSLKLKDTKLDAETNYTVEADSTISFTEIQKENITITLPLTNMSLAAIRLEISPQEAPDQKSTAKRKRMGTAFAVRATLKNGTNDTKLPFYFGDADHKQERYSNGDAILGVTDLWQISTDQESEKAVWLFEKPLHVSTNQTLVVNLGNAAARTVRLSVTPFAAAEPLESGADEQLTKALKKKLSAASASNKKLLAETYLLSSDSQAESRGERRKLEGEIRLCRDGRADVTIVESWQPAVTRILPRGNWQDETSEIVSPAVPHFLPQPAREGTNRLTRLDLANWLISPENPLTARAVMNRLWKQFFGTGISAVVDDLGAQGEWPTHPELMDWLACEFMQPLTPASPTKSERLKPWDFKHMVRLMVLSETYRQDSNERPELKEIDPNNRLLAYQSPRRLEAEFVRDNALAIADLLNPEVGGPSAFPYQPPGYYANLQFPDRDYYADKDQRQYRRGVYAHWQRTFLQPMLANFDAPSREECVAARNVSTTPQQALTLLNDPTFVEASRVFAQHVLARPLDSDDKRLNFVFEKALARGPKPKEKQSLEEFLAEQRAHYRGDPKEATGLLHVGNAPPPPPKAEPAELAAWTQVCRVVLNLQETITRY